MLFDKIGVTSWQFLVHTSRKLCLLFKNQYAACSPYPSSIIAIPQYPEKRGWVFQSSTCHNSFTSETKKPWWYDWTLFEEIAATGNLNIKYQTHLFLAKLTLLSVNQLYLLNNYFTDINSINLSNQVLNQNELFIAILTANGKISYHFLFKISIFKFLLSTFNKEFKYAIVNFVHWNNTRNGHFFYLLTNQ